MTTAWSTEHPPIVVLFGGPSAEHDVSIMSGSAIADGLRAAGLEVQLVLVDLAGGWWWLPADHLRGERPPAAYDAPADLGAEGPRSIGHALDLLATADPAPLVFIALHGPFGEDGTIQGALEAAGIAYTGSGVAASAVGMNKALFKRLVRGLGLPVVDWREVSAARWSSRPDTVLAELDAFAGADEPRLMVKPARLGSSVGMTLAHDVSERRPALDEAFRFDSLAMVERYLPGARDLEVSILGSDDHLEQYGPGEIVSGREFYDYVAKYTPGMSQTSTRAEVEPRQRALLLKLARDTYRAVGAADFARIDFLVAGEHVYVSEINTIPGFTPISLFPTLPAASGLDFSAVCVRIVELAMARWADNRRRRLEPRDLPR
ncbi:MAG TPA: D-alanine--D-alanine ligase [Candidatus Saccharimonadales bacterium]|nr:D-alanine--D-alanine ligase [Candidatus Saccharimonadales bacterium]